MHVRVVNRVGLRAGGERGDEGQLEAAVDEVLRGAQLRERRRAPEEALYAQARRAQVMHALLQHRRHRVPRVLLLDAAPRDMHSYQCMRPYEYSTRGLSKIGAEQLSIKHTAAAACRTAS